MFYKETEFAMAARTGIVDVSLSPQAHDMMEISQRLFPGGPWKQEHVGQSYPLHWSDLGVLVVPEGFVGHFGNPIYVLGEKTLLRNGTIHVDKRTGHSELVVTAREDEGPRAAVDAFFVKSTIDQRESFFRGTIYVRHWTSPDRKKGAGTLASLLVYSASNRAADTIGKPLSDLWTHGLVITAGFYFHGKEHEYDGFVVVD